MHRRHRQRSIDTQSKSSMKNPFLSMRDRKYFLWWKRRSRSWMKVAYKQEKITSTSFFFLPNFNLPRPKAESMINDWKSAVLWKERRQEHKKVETLIQRLVSGSPRACYEDKRETTHQLILYLQLFPLYSFNFFFFFFSSSKMPWNETLILAAVTHWCSLHNSADKRTPTGLYVFLLNILGKNYFYWNIFSPFIARVETRTVLSHYTTITVFFLLLLLLQQRDNVIPERFILPSVPVPSSQKA